MAMKIGVGLKATVNQTAYAFAGSNPALSSSFFSRFFYY
jgi:hypothetical protein